MRPTLVLLLAFILLVTAAPTWAVDGDTVGTCRCQASHLLGSGCQVFGPCPCTCHCPLIGSCTCTCSGNQLDRPPAG